MELPHDKQELVYASRYIGRTLWRSIFTSLHYVRPLNRILSSAVKRIDTPPLTLLRDIYGVQPDLLTSLFFQSPYFTPVFFVEGFPS